MDKSILRAKLFFVFLFVFILFPSVIAITGTSDSYSVNSKADSVTSSASVNSTSFTQRFIGGIQAVVQYFSNLFTGRFGILESSLSANVTSTNVSACGVLNQEGVIHYLNQSVNSSGTCFTIEAENITLNCLGNNINYSQTTTGYAVLANGYNNTKITNCSITLGNGLRTNSYAIYLRNGRGGSIGNNTILTLGSGTTIRYNMGINLINYTNSGIDKNNITTNGRASYGVYIHMNSNSSTLVDNNITTNGFDSDGIRLDRNSFNVVRSNKVVTFGGSADMLFISSSHYNNISFNNLSTYTSPGSHPINLRDHSIGNIISNNNLSSNVQVFGVYLFTGANHTTVRDNIITLNGANSRGIFLQASSKYNNITGNNVSTLSTGGIGIFLISSSNDNHIFNNSVRSDGLSLRLETSTSNTVYNNHFNASGTIVFATNNAAYVNFHNTTQTSGTNIVGGSLIGGNYWSNNLGTGFSQTCSDGDNNGICDSRYQINPRNIDWSPLTLSDASGPAVEIYSPINASVVNGLVVIKANATDNIGIDHVIFQYMNSTVSWTNIAGCNDTISEPVTTYTCTWNTDNFSNSTEGYLIQARAFDGFGNSVNSTAFRYFIDRTKPIIFEMNVYYPAGQTSVRNSDNITLSATVTDSPSVAAGINYVQAYLGALNGNSWSNMSLFSGSKLSDQNSTWHLNVNISSSGSAIRYANISVFDGATPTNNNRTGDLWAVNIDNTSPENLTALSSTEDPYNNTLATFSVLVSDNYQLKSFIFSSNPSGIWVNDSAVNINESSYQINYEKVVYNGTFSYRFFVFDDAGNMHNTGSNSIDVQGNPPFPYIYLVEPNNSVILNNAAVNFTYYYTNGTMTNCSLYLNSVLNMTVENPSVDVVNNFSRSLADGSYDWFVSCNQYEDLGGVNTSVTYSSDSRFLSIDTVGPTVTITSPENVSYTIDTLNFNASLSEDGTWCGYSLNDASNISMALFNSTFFTYTYSPLTEGSKNLVVSCNDTANNFGSATRIFAVDFPNIEINITYPINNQDIVRGDDSAENEDDLGLIPNSFNITARVYNVSTNNGVSLTECYFYEGNSLLGSSATNNSGHCIMNYSKSGKSIGIKNISVNYSVFSSEDFIKDNNISQKNFSLIRFVTPLAMTNLSSEGAYIDGDLAILLMNVTKINVTGTSFYDPNNITANATSSSENDYPDVLIYPGRNISRTDTGRFITNVTANGSFDTEIRWEVRISDDSFGNLLGTSVHVDKDVCVPSFGSFSEWSVCSGGTQTRSRSDGCGTTEVQTQSCTTGGGEPPGGGGCTSTGFGEWSEWGTCTNGNQTRTRSDNCENVETQTQSCGCEAEWECEEWGSCVGGRQYRSCEKINNCADTSNRPQEVRSCGGLCEPDLKCEDWSGCLVNYDISKVLQGDPLLNGSQYRFCTDVAQCQEDVLDLRECSVGSGIETKIAKWCYEDYLEFYDSSSGELIGRVKQRNINGALVVDIGFLTTEFEGTCSYCYDGIKNFDETDVDCGGINCSACEVREKYLDWLFYVKLVLWVIVILLFVKAVYDYRAERPLRAVERRERAFVHVGKKRGFNFRLPTFKIKFTMPKITLPKFRIRRAERISESREHRVEREVSRVSRRPGVIRKSLGNIVRSMELSLGRLRTKLAKGREIRRARREERRRERVKKRELRRTRRIERKKFRVERRVARKSVREIKRRIRKRQIHHSEVADLKRQLAEWHNKKYYDTVNLRKKLDEFEHKKK